jgi:site-specific DNA recombinase
LRSIATQTQERAAHLRLAETLSAFLSRLRTTAKTLDVVERQRSSTSGERNSGW